MCSSTLFTFFQFFRIFLDLQKKLPAEKNSEKKKKVQNSITFQFKNEKVPVCGELIGVGFSIDFAVVSVPLGYRKISLTKISNRIQW